MSRSLLLVSLDSDVSSQVLFVALQDDNLLLNFRSDDFRQLFHI